MTTIGAALMAARQQIDASEARLLLRDLLGCSTAHIEAHRGNLLEASVERAFHDRVERRSRGEPIAYITGRREFYGRIFCVAPGVLIPRPETELIVDIVLGLVAPDSRPRILDMGTGSGCLAITLALELPRAEVTAIDLAADALGIARRNADMLCARVAYRQSDWFGRLGDERFDVIVANPPYIAAGDMHLSQGDLRFEPSVALVAGSTGLDALQTIVSDAHKHMAHGGVLLLEHGFDQAAPVKTMLEAGGFRRIRQHRDISGILRISEGRNPAPR